MKPKKNREKTYKEWVTKQCPFNYLSMNLKQLNMPE